ncbi:MAG: hypothetical protein E6Z39_05320, partial [Varibaculum cambriense]|nr:hypothetical protein [Varibaculum cambriense]
LLHRVRGAKRVSYSQVLRQRGQRWQQNLENTAAPSEHEKPPHQDAEPASWIDKDEDPDKLADQLARSEAAIREQSLAGENEDLDSPEDILESVDGEILPDSDNNF